MLKDRIRQLRKAKKWSQERLATKSKLTQATISFIESGRTKKLEGDTLMQLAAALGEDPEYIRTGRRPARAPEDSTQENEVLELFRKMGPASRETWIGTGRLILRNQNGARNLQQSAKREAEANSQLYKDRALLEVFRQLSLILKEHGPDALAGALDDLQSQARTHNNENADPRTSSKSTKA